MMAARVAGVPDVIDHGVHGLLVPERDAGAMAAAIDSLLAFVVTLLAILTPFAAIPVFLALTEGQGPAFRSRTADMAALTAAIQ